MQIKNFVFLLLINAFLLQACNLPAASPALIATISVVPTLPPIVLTNTIVPTIMVMPSVTPAIVQPTPTLTLFYDPTATATPSWTGCPLVITKNDTSAGDLLHILRCEDKFEYDLGPFAKGVYAAGPNNKFIVYVTNNGLVYAAKIGEQYLSIIVDLPRERFFTAVNKKVPTKFFISFMGEAPYYKLILFEKKFDQKKIYNLPVRIQE